MQVRRVEIVRNFVAQQIEAIPENITARRLIQLHGNENERDDHSQRVEQQHRSRSGQRIRRAEEDLRRRIADAIRRRRNSIAGSRIGFRRSMLRVRVRSLSPTSAVLQTATVSQHRIIDENSDEELRYWLCKFEFIFELI